MAANLKGNAAEAAQQFLDEAMKEAKEAQNSYEQYARLRYYLAVLLKGIALFGGLAVATLNVNKVALGIIISAAVLLDQLFSNHKRMMTETVAGAAIARTIRKVQNNYNDQVLDVIKANQKGDAAAAYELLLALARISAKTIRDEMDRIKTAVAEANIQFLSSLNLDQPVKTVLPHASEAPMAPLAVPQAPQSSKGRGPTTSVKTKDRNSPDGRGDR
jgi:hypothetical protein